MNRAHLLSAALSLSMACNPQPEARHVSSDLLTQNDEFLFKGAAKAVQDVANRCSQSALVLVEETDKHYTALFEGLVYEETRRAEVNGAVLGDPGERHYLTNQSAVIGTLRNTFVSDCMKMALPEAGVIDCEFTLSSAYERWSPSTQAYRRMTALSSRFTDEADPNWASELTEDMRTLRVATIDPKQDLRCRVFRSSSMWAR